MIEVLNTPLFLTWEVTNRCNLRCKVCYNASTDMHPSEINESEASFIIDAIADCKPIFVNLTGGEPFLRPDIVKIAKRFIDKGTDPQLATNGSVYNEEMFLQMKSIGVKSIQVSFDGFEAAHDAIRGSGSFKRALKTLKFLIDNGFSAKVGTIVTRLNYLDIAEFTKYFYELGIKKLGVFRFVPTGRGRENQSLQLDADDLVWLQEKLEQLESRYGIAFFKCDHSLAVFLGKKKNAGGCELGLKCLCIKPNGDVLGCPFFPVVLGNVRETSLVKIWQDSPILKEIREDIRPERLLGKCVSCPNGIKEKCRGGCKALAYETTGSIRQPDPRCWR
ncbi:MAG: radical SAM protein [Deltaproteobacteria bacterium]|nr:radical SAM protein [Deltaproteobacteria bacterium]